MKSTLLYINILILFFGLANAQNGALRGQILDDTRREPLDFLTVVLLPTQKFYHTDLTGTFEFNNLAPGEYTLWVHYPPYPATLAEGIIVSPNTSSNLEVIYKYPFCKYGNFDNPEIIDTLTCPICTTKKHTIPISYGFPSNKSSRLAEKGKLLLGGCEFEWCMPHWYCKKDDIRY